MAVVTILGAGVMGSAMSLPLSDRRHKVRLVGTHLDGEIIDSVRTSARHPRLAVKIPPLEAFYHRDFAKALADDTDLIILGVSSAGISWAIDRLCESLRQAIPVVMITKGLHPVGTTITTLPDYVQSEVMQRAGLDLDVAAVGGPCIAGELAVRRHTGVTITSRRYAFAKHLCAMLATDYYHPRPSADVAGVEICAAFKNFFAIAVGFAIGALEQMTKAENGALNHNAAAILFGQATREMMTLARYFGGEAESVWGMPGAGDLYVTCQAGRNSRLGNNLGRGLTYREIKSGPMKNDTIEGAELGIALAPVLDKLTHSGALDTASLPVTRALLDTLVDDRPFLVPWDKLHATGIGVSP